VPAILAIGFVLMFQMTHPQIQNSRVRRKVGRLYPPNCRENCWANLCISQPSRHNASHRSVDKRLTEGGRPLVVPTRQQAVDKVVVDIFSRHKDAGNPVEPSGSPYKRPPKNIPKSTSARGRPVEEDAGLVLAYSRQRSECPQEKCWEGYDPGMDPRL